jgi:hypothetical protein
MTLELDNSQDYNQNNSSHSKSKFQKKEHKWKELLYNLFYEIKSEILNTKLEIEEDEYQENINSTTIPQLVNYIHDSIQILLKKKIEDTKEEQKELDKKFYLNSNLISNDSLKKINLEDKYFLEYESVIKNLESKQRILTKNIFQQKLQIDAMENKIEEYMEMEDEFEEMKTKLKYEDGRFLNNDRKDNEILIIRGENSILKNEINKLEEKVKALEEEANNKEKKIEEISKELEKLKNKFDEKQNEANTAPSININISNVHSNSNINNNNNEINSMNNNETEGGNLMKKSIYNPNRNSTNFITNSKFFYNYVNEQISINNKKNTFSSKKKKEKTEKMNHKNYYRNKTSKDKKLLSQKIKTKLLNNKNNICDLLSTTRNESLDRAKQDLLNKYLIGIKGNKNIMNLNNSCMKVNSLTGKIYYKKNGNNNMNNIQIQSNKKNGNEFNCNRSKSNSNKTKPPSASQSHNVISYRSVS